jgi:hypothetical protein
MARRVLAAIAALTFAVASAACGGVGAGGAGAHDNDGPARVSFDTPAAKEKLGQDDGFQAAIFYGAELMGSIDDCGCPGHPQGGLPWRLGYTEGFRSTYPDVAFAQVDAGHSMSQLVDVNGTLYPDQVAKNDWVLKAFEKFNFDAANISHNDAYFLAPYLREGVWDKAVAEHPMLARFVSANLQPTKPGVVAPPPYVVREIAGKRVPGGSVRVAFVGITENNPNLPDQTGFLVQSADQALERVLPQARSEADLVVVLAYASPDAVRPLGERFKDKVDAWIVAHPRARDTEPSLDGPVRTAFARYQTRNLGELRLHLDGKRLTKVANRYVTLDEQLPKDPVAAQMAADAKDAIRKAQEERFASSTPSGGAPAGGK